MERIKLEAQGREKAGSGLNALRREGIVPAVLYGKKKEPKLLKLPLKILDKALATEAGFNAIFDLTLDGKSAGLVRIREYQADPLKRNLTHVDFQVVDLKEKIEVEVPIHIIGKSEGVKKGGVLEFHRRTLHLKCLVTNIPDKIEIDVSALEIGDGVHADRIHLPEGVEFPHETNFTVVSVVPPAKEEEAKPAVTAEEGAAVSAEGAAPAAGAEAKPGAPAGEAKEKGKEEKKKDEKK